jgi:hypothetical protein
LPSWKQNLIGLRIGAGILIAWDLFAIYLAVNLLQRGQGVASGGWFLIAAFFLVLTVFFFLPASSVHGSATVSIPRYDSSYGNDLVDVLHSTDRVKVEVLRAKLEANGIPAEIAGEHTTRMLGHLLPEIPLRLMVPRSDLPRASELLKEDDNGT